MTKLKWLIFIGICAAILIGVIFASKGTEIDVSKVDANKAQTSGEFIDHTEGDKNAKVTLVQYGDYQCPGCGAAYPIVKDVVATNQKDILFVFRNLPLTNIHPNALAAATVAEAAGRQGKYFEMHDALYDNQSAWENATGDQRGTIFESYAKSLGLNMTQYKTDLSSTEVARKINRDVALAKKIGAQATPTFVLNGKTLTQDQWSVKEGFNKAIAGALLAAGVTPILTPPASQ
ncbi:MAG TPA: thioredoxin domain-containing protein [Candidatus Saccharimonadales bacterium]|jgi:protein-disulfide isomerase|nr:thioredoxin domain-containing protein [Candidatus Saccharimonadales bacterium]